MSPAEREELLGTIDRVIRRVSDYKVKAMWRRSDPLPVREANAAAYASDVQRLRLVRQIVERSE